MTTIFAPITSASKAGISVIRLSGPKSRECLEMLGVKKNFEANQIKFCKIFDPKTAQLIDETVIAFFAAPNSFTGEDIAEISLHASPFIVKKLIRILSEIENVRMAEPGEFSKIAFLNNKIDLVQAEAIPDLISSETEAQHKQALRQLQGDLGKIYEKWRFQIIEISALTESCIDFPDDDLPQNVIDELFLKLDFLKNEIASHINDKNRGQKIKDGLSLAIIGAPNVGKSSLLNFLAKSEVAIVSDIAGTTRDVIEIHLEIAGVAIKIADTAGLRISEDKIEQEGVKRAYKKAAAADLKIIVIDVTNPESHLDLIDENTIIILNKIDLPHDEKIYETYPNAIRLSIEKNQNSELLIKKLSEKVLEILPNQSSPLITQERYRKSLIEALNCLENFSLDKNIELSAEDLRLAALEISKITGRINVDDILDVIFSKFCIGK